MDNCPNFLELGSLNIEPSGHIKCYLTGCVRPEDEVCWHEIRLDICKAGQPPERYAFNIPFALREAIVELLEPTMAEISEEAVGPIEPI